jgi:general secretion pathway protein I
MSIPFLQQQHPSRFCSKSPQAAFTLLEVMVAVAIIAISFVSLLGSQSQSVSIAAISRFETTASMLARQKLAELQLEDFVDLSSGSGAFEDDFAGYDWQVEVENLTEDDTGISGADELLKVVDLTVTLGNNPDMTFHVRTVVMTEIEPKDKS